LWNSDHIPRILEYLVGVTPWVLSTYTYDLSKFLGVKSYSKKFENTITWERIKIFAFLNKSGKFFTFLKWDSLQRKKNLTFFLLTNLQKKIYHSYLRIFTFLNNGSIFILSLLEWDLILRSLKRSLNIIVLQNTAHNKWYDNW